MVYVDPIRTCSKSKRWPYTKAAHLVADTVEQLHNFAGRLGLRRQWFQDRPGLPHYDLTVGMRWQAIRKGAIEITQKQLVEMMNANRKIEDDENHRLSCIACSHRLDVTCRTDCPHYPAKQEREL